jgi:hypothetical protein
VSQPFRSRDGIAEVAQGHPEIAAVGSIIGSCSARVWRLWEKTLTEPSKKERAKPASKKKEHDVSRAGALGVSCVNANPEEAARQVVTDLFEHLSRGGSVSMHVEEPDGKAYTFEVSAR